MATGDKNMREIDLWKVLCNVVKRIWLPAFLALGGMVVALSVMRFVPARWEFSAIYLVDIQQPDERLTDFDTYQFEFQLANTISQMLSRNLKDEDIKNFTLTSSNRRIYVSGIDRDKEYLQLIADQIEISAKECLQTEIGTNAVLKTEKYIIDKQEESDSNPIKIVLLGGLVGLCIGFAILLLLEYMKSPAVLTDSDKRGRQP